MRRGRITSLILLIAVLVFLAVLLIGYWRQQSERADRQHRAREEIRLLELEGRQRRAAMDRDERLQFGRRLTNEPAAVPLSQAEEDELNELRRRAAMRAADKAGGR